MNRRRTQLIGSEVEIGPQRRSLDPATARRKTAVVPLRRSRLVAEDLGVAPIVVALAAFGLALLKESLDAGRFSSPPP